MSAAAACNLDLDAFLTKSGRGDHTLATAGAVLHRIASEAIEVARIISLGNSWEGSAPPSGPGTPTATSKRRLAFSQTRCLSILSGALRSPQFSLRNSLAPSFWIQPLLWLLQLIRLTTPQISILRFRSGRYSLFSLQPSKRSDRKSIFCGLATTRSPPGSLSTGRRLPGIDARRWCVHFHS